ncbi:MAG TPA: DUF2147 domain-containing protein [Chthoniobacterales bacterium]
MKRSLLAFLLTLMPLVGRADENRLPVGFWKNEDATIEIYESKGKLEGKVASLNQQYTTDGQEKTDIHNPALGKRSRPLIGLVFMTGFTPASPGRWKHGTVYDPKSGNTYSSILEYDGGDTLRLRGYIGISLIGRTAVLTRAKE